MSIKYVGRIKTCSENQVLKNVYLIHTFLESIWRMYSAKMKEREISQQRPSAEEWQREVPGQPLWIQPRGSHHCQREQDDGVPAPGRRAQTG